MVLWLTSSYHAEQNLIRARDHGHRTTVGTEQKRDDLSEGCELTAFSVLVTETATSTKSTFFIVRNLYS